MKPTSKTKKHNPVLLEQVINLLEPKPNDSYLDLTAGYGGHASAIIERTKAPFEAVLIDRDEAAIRHLSKKMPDTVTIQREDFLSATTRLTKENKKFDLILLDVGVSSPQFDNPDRGFSFQHEAKLDMRMDSRQKLTAATFVNHASQKELADLIYKYGEERKSRQIARAIVQNRPIMTTIDLADLIVGTIGRRGRIHPATRTFQALRIAVNDELNQLKLTLPKVSSLLTDGGRMAVISFHSLEDRIVKHFIKDATDLTNLTKKPISGKTEDVSNPRARSAKLRAAVKTKTKRRQNSDK